jgi:lysophospholipase L1-like esterase
MLFKTRQRILFIGDSITDCGRRDVFAPYGNGYVQVTRSLLAAAYPNLDLTIINRGIGGNTVRDLAVRWERDVLAEQPDWLLIKIGINDVWRAFSDRLAEAVPLDEYVATYRTLIERTRNGTKAQLILLTPYLIEPNRAEPMRAEMDRYGAAVAELAREYNTLLVDTQFGFDRVLSETEPNFWAEDRIHPGLPGHTVLAITLLAELGFSLP